MVGSPGSQNAYIYDLNNLNKSPLVLSMSNFLTLNLLVLVTTTSNFGRSVSLGPPVAPSSTSTLLIGVPTAVAYNSTNPANQRWTGFSVICSLTFALP